MDKISQQVADEKGNKLIVMISGNVFLKLTSEKRNRKLGIIQRAKRCFIVKRKRHKHLHNKSNSYGFNHHFLSKAKTFDKILLKDEYAEYEFPLSKLLDHGRFLFFEKVGFEKQIFLPLEIMEQFKKSSSIKAF